MQLQEMYEEFRATFPEITRKADIVHIKLWGELDPSFAYSWFESLANAINHEMSKSSESAQYRPIFEYFRQKYLFENNDIKNCIDVAFVENLFWRVKAEHASPYWALMPDILKQLYIQFHGRSRC
ncbi:DUF7674 family protein [Thalassotalea euphylliae]|uniref:DUF7674 domain-containing protein n=1 Tax=Thalassotalea euphylliae TaxID=1655234 RepID=A0A3E0UIC1_9GAMM|nr:hypothetical protein [Thalassotalea euphylliae]REL36344.1 hypothetical protein DXX92_14040 [Thalassotalea euphylliae]